MNPNTYAEEAARIAERAAILAQNLRQGVGQAVVEGGGGGDDHGVGRGDHRLGREGGAAGLPGHQGGPGRIGIVQADELEPRPLGGLQRVEPAEMPGPQDAQPKTHAA